MVEIAQEVVEATRSVIGNDPAPLHAPYLPKICREFANRCISSGMLGAGHWVDEFEQMLCKVTGAKYAVAMCNATCALEVALACERINGINDYLKIPALTFVATANAAMHAGRNFWFTEPEDATLPVHLMGEPSKAKGSIHDAAQALGSKIEGYHAAIYSFNQNKIITTGGGGALITDDEVLAAQVKHLITTARVQHPYRVEHDSLAWNYRMPDINAAIGLGQLMEFNAILAAKKALNRKYAEAFKGIKGISFFKHSPASNCWLNAILVDDESERIKIITELHLAGYQARMLPTPLHMLPMYSGCDKDDLSKTEGTWKRTICLPSGPGLGMKFI